MSQLKMIQKYCIQLSNAMAAILQYAVVMLDENLNIVAGTGIYGEKVDLVFDQTTVSYRVLVTGEKLVIPNAGEHEICLQCSNRIKCPDLAEICLPIVVKNEVIGVFAIIALDEEQRQRLIGQENILVEFVRRVSDLISFTIEAGKLTEKLSLLAGEFNTVVNSVNDGIIAVNGAQVITMVNQSAMRMLQLHQEQLVGEEISSVFSDPLLIEALHQGTILLNQEIYIKTKNKKKYFMGNLAPINERDGHVLVIRNIDEVTRMVGDYLLKDRLFTFDDIIGNSAVTRQIKNMAKHVALSDSTILLYGESGVGKEMFARAIHTESQRSGGPFVTVNCGAIPDTLLESELFGYEDGAFSGAKRGGKVGRFELANKGTLFLDEIGDLPLHLQVKILRVLQVKQLDRLGGTRPVAVDFRIIVATNKNLEDMVAKGEFREDLYYRFNVIPINIPPLRERRDDILALLDYSREKFNELLDKQIKGYSPEARKELLSYEWPGNVRELENAIEYAVNMEAGEVIMVQSLPGKILTASSREEAGHMEYQNFSLALMEKKTIMKALNYFGRSTAGKERASAVLGIGIATLYRKIKEYRL